MTALRLVRAVWLYVMWITKKLNPSARSADIGWRDGPSLTNRS
jgi:hypothetical protein